MLKGAALLALGYALGYAQAIRGNEETMRTLDKLSDAVKEATRVMAEKDTDVKSEDLNTYDYSDDPPDGPVRPPTIPNPEGE